MRSSAQARTARAQVLHEPLPRELGEPEPAPRHLEDGAPLPGVGGHREQVGGPDEAKGRGAAPPLAHLLRAQEAPLLPGQRRAERLGGAGGAGDEVLVDAPFRAEAGPQELSLTVTDDAAAYIRECADRDGLPHAVRLRIHAGGCSGLEYSIDLAGADAAPGSAERSIESNGVTVLLDLKSAIYVSGSVIDYTSSLMRRGFVIRNPNATTTCSCGDSFGV